MNLTDQNTSTLRDRLRARGFVHQVRYHSGRGGSSKKQNGPKYGWLKVLPLSVVRVYYGIIAVILGAFIVLNGGALVKSHNTLMTYGQMRAVNFLLMSIVFLAAAPTGYRSFSRKSSLSAVLPMPTRDETTGRVGIHYSDRLPPVHKILIGLAAIVSSALIVLDVVYYYHCFFQAHVSVWSQKVLLGYTVATCVCLFAAGALLSASPIFVTITAQGCGCDGWAFHRQAGTKEQKFFEWDQVTGIDESFASPIVVATVGGKEHRCRFSCLFWDACWIAFILRHVWMAPDRQAALDYFSSSEPAIRVPELRL